MKKEKINQTNKSEMIIYKTTKKDIKIDVRFEGEMVWLSQLQMAQLFAKNVRTINEHVKNLFKEGELQEKAVIRKFRITASDGKSYETSLYNLDVIISVGYRVKSQQGVQFRIWATSVLKSYLLKGYAVNESRLLEAQSRFNELRETVAFLKEKSGAENLKGQEKEIIELLATYANTFTLLEKYDSGNLKEIKGGKPE